MVIRAEKLSMLLSDGFTQKTGGGISIVRYERRQTPPFKKPGGGSHSIFIDYRRRNGEREREA